MKDIKSSVTLHDDHYPYFSVVVNGWSCGGFALSSVQKEHWKWMTGIVERQIVDAYKRGLEEAERDTKKAIKDALGL